MAREGPETIVAMLDDTEPSLVHTLFGQHRDAVWRLPICWVVVGNSASTPEYLRPPADAFFEEIVELGPLSQAEAVELLERRLDGTPVHDEILRGIAAGQGADTPRGLLGRARRVLLEAEDPARLVRGYANATTRSRHWGGPRRCSQRSSKHSVASLRPTTVFCSGSGGPGRGSCRSCVSSKPTGSSWRATNIGGRVGRSSSTP